MIFMEVDSNKCTSSNGCDTKAFCGCGTVSGIYQCVCKQGYYGSGIRNYCFRKSTDVTVVVFCVLCCCCYCRLVALVAGVVFFNAVVIVLQLLFITALIVSVIVIIIITIIVFVIVIVIVVVHVVDVIFRQEGTFPAWPWYPSELPPFFIFNL